MNDNTDYGAIINQTQLDSIDNKVQEAIKNGADLVLGGHKLDRPVSSMNLQFLIM